MPTRVIRDGWVESEAIAILSPEAEVFYLHLCLRADDFGRYHANPLLLRSNLFPLRENVTAADCGRWLEECCSARSPDGTPLVVVYAAEGKRYCYIPKHGQRTKSESRSKFPEPSEDFRELPGTSGNCPEKPGTSGLARARSESEAEAEAVKRERESEPKEANRKHEAEFAALSATLKFPTLTYDIVAHVAMNYANDSFPEIVRKMCIEVAGVPGTIGDPGAWLRRRAQAISAPPPRERQDRPGTAPAWKRLQILKEQDSAFTAQHPHPERWTKIQIDERMKRIAEIKRLEKEQTGI